MMCDTISLQVIGITLLLYTCRVTGFQDFVSEKCVTQDAGNSSRHKLCVEDKEHQIYPGRTKTLLINLYVPQGPTHQAYIAFYSSSDNSVIVTDAFLAFRDDNLNSTHSEYKPYLVEMSKYRAPVMSHIEYYFGDIYCNGCRENVKTTTESPINTESTESSVKTESTESPVNTESTESSVKTESTESPVNTESTESSVKTESTESPVNTGPTESSTITVTTESQFSTDSVEPSSTTAETSIGQFRDCCLLQLAVEILMVNLFSSDSNQTAHAYFVSDTGTIKVTTTLVLKPLHNSAKTSNFSTDIPDEVVVPLSRVSTFRLQALFPYPLSRYKLALASSDKRLRIAAVLIRAVGEHYKDTISTFKSPHPDDELFCSEGPDDRVIDFGYLPNTGADDSNSSAMADTVDFEVVLLMTEEAIPGETFPLVITLEVNYDVTQSSTKYFKASGRLPMKTPVVQQNQNYTLLPYGGSRSVYLSIIVPPLSSGLYEITPLTTKDDSGLEGLEVGAVSVDHVGINLPCIGDDKYWRQQNVSLYVSNVPYINESLSNTITFKISVVAYPESVKKLSTYKLTAHVMYPGNGSPQVFEFVFKIDEEDIEEEPGRMVQLERGCTSLSFTNDVTLDILTGVDKAYGRLNVEIPVPSELTRQTFAVCNVVASRGINIFGRFTTNFTKGANGTNEKAVVTMSPLTNINLESNIRLIPNDVEIKMTLTFINKSMSEKPTETQFPVRIIRDNINIWEKSVPIYRPIIHYYPDFIVLSKLSQLRFDNPQDIWFHYSRNGSYFYQEKLAFDTNNEVDWSNSPKFITHFYFSSTSCKPVCSIVRHLKPLTHYITVANDGSNTILRVVYLVLDHDLDTCIDLPVPGDTPSMLWLRVKQLSLFNVSSNHFLVHITGEDLKCVPLGQKSVKVGTSGPPVNNKCSMDSDMVFCKLVSENANASLTHCSMECRCDNTHQCSNVHIIMQTTTKDAWRLCEIAIQDKV